MSETVRLLGSSCYAPLIMYIYRCICVGQRRLCETNHLSEIFARVQLSRRRSENKIPRLEAWAPGSVAAVVPEPEGKGSWRLGLKQGKWKEERFGHTSRISGAEELKDVPLWHTGFSAEPVFLDSVFIVRGEESSPDMFCSDVYAGRDFIVYCLSLKIPEISRVCFKYCLIRVKTSASHDFNLVHNLILS